MARLKAVLLSLVVVATLGAAVPSAQGQVVVRFGHRHHYHHYYHHHYYHHHYYHRY